MNWKNKIKDRPNQYSIDGCDKTYAGPKDLRTHEKMVHFSSETFVIILIVEKNLKKTL